MAGEAAIPAQKAPSMFVEVMLSVWTKDWAEEKMAERNAS